MEISRVAVVGGGTMGVGIARTLAGAGIDVVQIEKNPEAAKAARERLEKKLDRELARWGLTEAEKQAALGRVECCADAERAAECDLLIEAVDESFTLKKALFEKLDRLCPADTVFLTNTSTLSVTELARTTSRREKFAGLHFVNPVPKTKVAEVVRGLNTSDETVATAKDFARQMGKTPIEVFEYPGYVTTRVIIPMINEAVHVVMEGVASAEDVDTAMKLGYNLEMGPLALADRMGLEELVSMMEHLFRELGDLKYRPCPLLRKMVRAGRLGVKTGEGFFRYDEPEEL